METLTDRFSTYFGSDVASAAAKSIGNGAEIEFQIHRTGTEPAETFTFTKKDGKNAVMPGPARDPQLVFTMNEPAAHGILEFQSDNVGEIGIHLAKMVIATKKPGAEATDRKLDLHFKAGFLTLFSKGYFGVLTSGGAQLASYLASHGLSGIGAFKAILSKRKSK